MDLTEKAVTQEYIYEGRIIKLHVDKAELPNKKIVTREVVEHNGGVCVVAIDNENNIYMVEQFRYPYMQTTLEIPAGKRDKDEHPLECGKRELKEETGAVSEHFEYLGELYPSPGYCGEIIYMYKATGLSFGECDPDDDEFLNLKKIPLDTVVQMILKGEIKDAKTQAAVLKVKLLANN